MAVPYKHINPFRKRVINFTKQRIREIECDMEVLSNELEFQKTLLSSLNPCSDCYGMGYTTRMHGPDETEKIVCSTCDGDGSLSQNSERL